VRIIAQLRQRRVLQWTFSYIVGGWLVLEALDMFTERGYLHHLFYDVGVIWVVLAGLPAAMIIGWYHGEKGDQEAPLAEKLMLSMLAVIALGLSGWTATRPSDELEPLEGALRARNLAVLYFDGRDLPEAQRYVADALTEDLIAELSRVRGLNVVSRNGSQSVRDVTASRDSLARLLDVGTLVEGAVEERNGRLIVTLRLFDGNNGAEFQRATLEMPSTDLLAARDGVVERASNLLRQFVGEEVVVRQRGAGTRVVAAWSHVQEAEQLRKRAVGTRDRAEANELLARAEELLTRAEVLDSTWVEPVVLRSEIALRQVRTNTNAPAVAEAAARAGVAHANRALAMDRNHARALELRATHKLLLHQLRLVPDPAEHAALRAEARADLERAVDRDAGLASALATLSALYLGEDHSAALLAAQRAYEADAFLEDAPRVLALLYGGSFDSGSFTQAQRWCHQGQRRFPRNIRFVECELFLMTTPAVQADPARGWQIVQRVDSLTPPAERAFSAVRMQLAMAAVLARASKQPGTTSLADSARSVLRRAESQIDPLLDRGSNLTANAAFAYVMLDEPDAALALLRRAVADGSHGFRADGQMAWRWRELQTHPGFRQLVTDR
jgi:TolB-like protein